MWIGHPVITSMFLNASKEHPGNSSIGQTTISLNQRL